MLIANLSHISLFFSVLCMEGLYGRPVQRTMKVIIILKQEEKSSLRFFKVLSPNFKVMVKITQL